MKAFEEWFEKTEGKYGDFDHESRAEAAWRAALEWVLSVSQDCGDWWADDIRKELEDE